MTPTIEYIFETSNTIEELLKTLSELLSKRTTYINGKCFTSINTEVLIERVEKLYSLGYTKEEIYENIMTMLLTR